jgi:hypothetical protein
MEEHACLARGSVYPVLVFRVGNESLQKVRRASAEDAAVPPVPLQLPGDGLKQFFRNPRLAGACRSS